MQNIHVFVGRFYHLVAEIIPRYCTLDPYCRTIVLVGPVDAKMRAKYEQKLSADLYGKMLFIEGRCEFFRYAVQNRQVRFILHGIHFTWMPFVLLAKADWINWGSGVRTNWRNPLSILGYPVKFIFYHSLRSVSALMDSDIVDLKRSFGLKEVHKLQYMLFCDASVYRKLLADHRRNTPLRVLVGNSAHCIDTYYEVADLLGQRDEEFTVNFMLQYPRQEEVTLARLSAYLDEHLHHPYQLDVEVMEIDDYYMYMGSFDIYICGSMEQSGLGAIGNSLMIGVAAVARGKNLEFERLRGMSIYDFDDLESASQLCDILLPKLVFEENLRIALGEVEVDRGKWMVFFEGDRLF